MDIVLVHGAGTGGWLWDDVAERLTDEAHRIWAPSLSGVGELIEDGGPDTDLSAHVHEVRDLVAETEPGVVLVGFSYGGLVAGLAAAEIAERVRRLIYVDAFVPQPGRSLFDALPALVAAQMKRLADEVGDGWKIPPAPLEMLGGLGRVSPAVDVELLHTKLARRGPHPIGTYQEVAPDRPSFPSERTRYISCTDKPPGDPMVAIARALDQAGVPVDELEAGHFAPLTVPDELASLLARSD